MVWLLVVAMLLTSSIGAGCVGLEEQRGSEEVKVLEAEMQVALVMMKQLKRPEYTFKVYSVELTDVVDSRRAEPGWLWLRARMEVISNKEGVRAERENFELYLGSDKFKHVRWYPDLHIYVWEVPANILEITSEEHSLSLVFWADAFGAPPAVLRLHPK